MGRASLPILCLGLLLAGPTTVHAQKKHPAEGKIKSPDVGVETTFKFVNDSKETIKVYWLDHEGERKLPATLKSGEQNDSKTFLGHVFLVTNEKGDAWYVYIADAQPRTVSIVAPQKTKNAPAPPKPTSHTTRKIEGWTVQVDDRLLEAPNDELGKKALRFLENKLFDITVVVPADRLKKLQECTIVLDLSHGKLRPMQYHPSAGWLKANGYSTDLAKCVHIPVAADLPTKRNINEQPWVILHELAHAYHDQVLGFDEPRIKEAYERYKKSGHGDKTLLFNGQRVKHYALTNQMEFFAEMTEAYFGVNDFFPFNRAELRESEPEIYALMREIWEGKGKP